MVRLLNSPVLQYSVDFYLFQTVAGRLLTKQCPQKLVWEEIRDPVNFRGTSYSEPSMYDCTSL